MEKSMCKRKKGKNVKLNAGKRGQQRKQDKCTKDDQNKCKYFNTHYEYKQTKPSL